MYYASFNANHTYNLNPIEYTSKQKAIKAIREIAEELLNGRESATGM